jgi:hypothetical protein
VSDVIQFLEALACHPRGLERRSREEALASMDPDAREALLAGDAVALARALDARPVMACFVAAPENDEPAEDEQPAEQDEPERPDSEAA